MRPAPVPKGGGAVRKLLQAVACPSAVQNKLLAVPAHKAIAEKPVLVALPA